MQQQIDALGPVADGTRANNPDEAQDIESVMERLANLKSLTDNDDLAVQYGQLLRDLQTVERELRSDDEDTRPTIIANSATKIDPKDRPAIDRYYRALSDPVKQ